MFISILKMIIVAPLVGAWIEINFKPHNIEVVNRRSSRGSVD